MKYKTMHKNLRQSIRKSLGRYIAIVAIIALGAGMFVGLRISQFDMVATGQKYMDEQNMFDLQLLNTYGWSQAELDQIAQTEGIENAEGAVYLDAIINGGDGEKDLVYRFHSIPQSVNKVRLRGGRMPESPDECLADGFYADDSILGKQITISPNNTEKTVDSFAFKTYTVVGYISSPLYMNSERGNTSIGSGILSNYLYIPIDGFDVDYFTQINVTLPGNYDIYTREYDDAMDHMADKLEKIITPLAEERLIQLRRDAEKEYQDGLTEYEEGLKELNENREDAISQLEDAKKQLEDGEAELEQNRKIIENGEVQIQDTKDLLDQNAVTLAESKKALAESKADAYAQLASSSAELLDNYKTVSASLREVESGLSQLDGALNQIKLGVMVLQMQQIQADAGVAQMDTMLSVIDTAIEATQTAIEYAKQSEKPDEAAIAEMEKRLAQQKQTKEEYTLKREQIVEGQTTNAEQLSQLQQQQEELTAQKEELDKTKVTLDDAMASIELGMKEMQNGQTQVDNQFVSAESKLEAGEIQIDSAWSQLDDQTLELEAGKKALEDAEKELEAGWKEYEQSRLEVNQKFSDARQKLTDAEAQLDDAREAIDKMTETSVYVMTRRSNVGYMGLESNADILAGVSRVFPVFFLMVAALVCITTMSRMVGEERTQIGVLKALGYSNGAIISKYLLYAGSAAVIGCCIGVVLGSIIFPMVLWEAYCIMLYITPNILLSFDWGLSAAVVAIYTAVMLLASWYSCRRVLKEVPAELMRPKAPTSGKKILMEYCWFWKKLRFLNKVMFRNIFRYRQRLLMMILGIGGCTALLVTGFGIRDSVANIADYQFEEVANYDMAVYFADGRSEKQQEQFRQNLRGSADSVHFLHQSSVEVDYDGQSRDIYMISSDEELQSYIDLHRGDKSLYMPENGELLLSSGVADIIGVKAGDHVTLRDPDMRELKLTVSEIYDNHVENYGIVSPETIRTQWDEEPELQMAYVNVPESLDIHKVGSKIAGLEDVMNVSISQDIQDSVGTMMDALDLVVVMIVSCAGLLAVIVLYNLINININERIREIATIKVLGFKSLETAAYVFKENLLLSAFGAVAGLAAGRLLLNFVMSQIKVDMVWFEPRVAVMSYVGAVILTMLAACMVDLVFYFKLEKINMAESLKSME